MRKFWQSDGLSRKRWFLGYALLGVLCLTVLLGVVRFISDLQEATARAYSAAVVKGFGSSVITYRDYYGKFPAATWGETFRILQGEDSRGQNPSNVIFHVRDPQSKTSWMVDGWERPIFFSIESNVVRVWSSGSNGKDELGSGDDIVVEKR